MQRPWPRVAALQSSTRSFFPLERLSNDVLFYLVDTIGSYPDISALSRISRRFYSILNPYLYGYDAKRGGNYALWWAAANKRIDVALRSLAQGGDVHTTSCPYIELCAKVKRVIQIFNVPEGTSLLFLTVNLQPCLLRASDEVDTMTVRRHRLVRLFLDQGISLNTSAIKKAALQGDDALVRLMINRDTDGKLREWCPELLVDAAEVCSANTIRFLIDRGFSVDCRSPDETNSTALLRSLENLNIGAAKALVRRGADVNAHDASHRTPLDIAGVSGATTLVSLLIRHGADVNKACSFGTLLGCAIIAAEPENVMQLLIDAGADPNPQLAQGSLLCDAIEIGTSGSPTAVEILLDNGADVHSVGHGGLTALLLAAREPRKSKIIRLLVENGANLDDRDSEGCTALHYAVKMLYPERVKECLSMGFDVNAKDNAGNTPLHHVTNRNKSINVRIVQSLLEGNADVNASNNDGYTPLHKLLWSRLSSRCNTFWKSMGMLLEAGADIKATTNDGTAILDEKKLSPAIRVELFKRFTLEESG